MYQPKPNLHHVIPSYSSDIKEACRAQSTVPHGAFLRHLREEVNVPSVDQNGDEIVMLMVYASPEQRCRAALKAAREEDEEQDGPDGE